MNLKNIKAFGKDFDILVARESPDNLKVTIINDGKSSVYKISDGKSVAVKL